MTKNNSEIKPDVATPSGHGLLLSAGAGEMGMRLRALDHGSTVLGAMKDWPQSLRTAVEICLNCRFSMAVWWGPELTLIYNDAYIPLLGQRHPDALGRPAREAWGDTWTRMVPHFEMVMHRGEPSMVERDHCVVERTGSNHDAWITWCFTPLPNDEGGVGGVLSTCTDETARVIAERDRDFLDEQRRMALDAANLGWWHVDGATGDVFYDARFGEYFGIPPEAGRIKYEEAIRSIHDQDRARVDAAVKAATDPLNPQPYGIEYRTVHSDGSMRWVFARGRAYFTGEGSTRRYTDFVGTIANITDRKSAHQERHDLVDRYNEESRRLSRLLSSITDFAYTFDLDGRFTFANKPLLDLWGLTLEQAVGKNFFDLKYPEDLATVLHRQIEHVIRTGQRIVGETAYTSPTGVSGYFAYIFSPVFGTDGSVESAAGSTRDITIQKRAEAKLEQLLERERAARNEADTANRSKDDFLAMVSHELRTPLSVVLLWSKMLRSGKLDDAQRSQALNTIIQCAEEQAMLVDDLLDASRFLHGKTNAQMLPVNLAELVGNVVNTLQPVADAKRVCVTVSHSNEQVRGDSLLLQRMFSNLLTNAIKFTQTGGHVKVSLSRTGEMVELQVKDDGDGIDPAFLPHLFDAFRQSDGSSTRKHGGLGLGLSIVRHIVELHGGFVDAKSEGLGHGATLSVHLLAND